MPFCQELRHTAHKRQHHAIIMSYIMSLPFLSISRCIVGSEDSQLQVMRRPSNTNKLAPDAQEQAYE